MNNDWKYTATKTILQNAYVEDENGYLTQDGPDFLENCISSLDTPIVNGYSVSYGINWSTGESYVTGKCDNPFGFYERRVIVSKLSSKAFRLHEEKFYMFYNENYERNE